MAKKTKTPDYIVPLDMNGMKGRMLRLPPKKNAKKEILLVYGHHASIERMEGMAVELNRYGGVTLPDLPGFGGMDTFYSIGQHPTLDNLADYLASFIKLRYNRRRLTIMGVSFGFVIATRMLQRHPDIVNKVDLLVSVVSFVHKDDFAFKRRNYLLLRWTASFLSRKYPALFVRYFLFNRFFIRWTYLLFADRNIKLKDASKTERDKRIDFEIKLWQINDVRTYMDTTLTMFTLDLLDHRVNLPVQHIAADDDRYFNNEMVEQHMRIIFADFNKISSNIKGHAPTVIATAKQASVFIPAKIRYLLKHS